MAATDEGLSETASRVLRGVTLEVVREIFKGFLMLRLRALIPLLIVIVVLLGVSELRGGSAILGIAILAAVPPSWWLCSDGSWRGGPVSDLARRPRGITGR